MGAQSLWRRVVTCQFAFRQCGVNFVMANLVEQHGRAVLSASQLRDKMVHRLLGPGWDFTQAKRAEGIFVIHSHHSHPLSALKWDRKTQLWLSDGKVI